MGKFYNRDGFTLIELMLVVSIIGLLSAIAIPSFMEYEGKSKQTEAKINLRGVATAEDAYFGEKNMYTDDILSAGYINSGGAKYYDFTATDQTGGPFIHTWIGVHQNTTGCPDAALTVGYQGPTHMPGTTSSRYVAVAVGNIDTDMTADVWSISSDYPLTPEQDDITL